MSCTTVENYLSAAAVAGHLLVHPSVSARWDEPSALANWSVAGLAGHLARAVFSVEWHTNEPIDATAPLTDVVSYYASVPDQDLEPESAVAGTIRDRGLQSAGPDHSGLISRYDAALDRLVAALPQMDTQQPVMTFGRLLPLRDCLRARQLELVVHTDDLAVSVGQPSPVFPETVIDDVIAILGAVAARRHTPLAVVRALARVERSDAPVSAFSSDR